jgi:hypothetical protein
VARTAIHRSYDSREVWDIDAATERAVGAGCLDAQAVPDWLRHLAARLSAVPSHSLSIAAPAI